MKNFTNLCRKKHLILQFSSQRTILCQALELQLSRLQILTSKYFALCLSQKPSQETVWLKSIKIFLLLTQVVIGITTPKRFNYFTAMGVEVWGFSPWSILDQVPNHFLNNHVYPQYGVNKQNNIILNLYIQLTKLLLQNIYIQFLFYKN